jgi:hypothetical protein
MVMSLRAYLEDAGFLKGIGRLQRSGMKNAAAEVGC